MSDKKRLFGTFGVRRTANDVLTPEFASRLAACYGTFFLQHDFNGTGWVF